MSTGVVLNNRKDTGKRQYCPPLPAMDLSNLDSTAFAKAELSKLCFAEAMEPMTGRAVPGFDGKPGVVCTVIVEASVVPSFAKEGWTRPKEDAAKLPLIGAAGGAERASPIGCSSKD